MLRAAPAARGAARASKTHVTPVHIRSYAGTPGPDPSPDAPLASSRARSTFRANLPFFLMCAGLVELCSYAHMFTRRVSGADDAEDTAAQGDAEDAADQSETSASGSTAGE